ncbi:hypothetical protein Mag101_07350 [Microbulbifer agarilyticus]|uniref:RNA polymerase sigma factor 70 region 4 type 2 domain-containing protein n=1 Tax=Microbulbifer agarilyticus TaxID=260552 RepID=A0A1Q2M419_9GAMM|nr:hypothetical protein [Microbulbifer agarilyticus]AQQ67474.1 hypothetical protein Mag101_07350 [Microbulbifer agarilyticus]
MIERVHIRFQEWANAVEGVGRGSVMGSLGLIAGSGTAEGTVPINSDVREVEQFVLELPEDLRSSVMLYYLPPYLTHDQAAKKLGVSMRTLYRRIDGVHVLFNAKILRGVLPKVS